MPVHVRRQRAEREMARLTKKGQAVSPVVIEGRAIAKTFWGQSWCRNLEGYSDYTNRLPRGADVRPERLGRRPPDRPRRRKGVGERVISL